MGGQFIFQRFRQAPLISISKQKNCAAVIFWLVCGQPPSRGVLPAKLVDHSLQLLPGGHYE